jgi:hypothetical protein
MWYYKYTCGIWYYKNQNYTYKFNISVLFMCYESRAINVAQLLPDMYDVPKPYTTAEHKAVLTYSFKKINEDFLVGWRLFTPQIIPALGSAQVS